MPAEVEQLFFLFTADPVINAAVFVFDLTPGEVSELLIERREGEGIGGEELLDIRGEHEYGAVMGRSALGFEKLIDLLPDLCSGRFPLLLEFCMGRLFGG